MSRIVTSILFALSLFGNTGALFWFGFIALLAFGGSLDIARSEAYFVAAYCGLMATAAIVNLAALLNENPSRLKRFAVASYCATALMGAVALQLWLASDGGYETHSAALMGALVGVTALAVALKTRLRFLCHS